MVVDLGERRRAYRERLRLELPEHDEHKGVIWLAFGFLFAGVITGGFAHVPAGALFTTLYCGPTDCYALPLALTGWALAALPVALCLVAPRYAVHLCAFILGFLATYFVTAAGDHPWAEGLWPLPLTYFLVVLLAVPASAGLAFALARGQIARLGVAALFHWVLLAALIVWLA